MAGAHSERQLVCAHTPQTARPVRLASRTLEAPAGKGAFPMTFAARQTPTARGTVTFAVVAAEPVSKAVRARAAACGARVLGFLPENALLVEADAAALRRLAADAAFTAAFELDPQDKLSADVRTAVSAASGDVATGGGALSDGAATVDVRMTPLAAEDRAGLVDVVRNLGGMSLPSAAGSSLLRVRVPAAAVAALARRGDVRTLERDAPARLHNNVAVNPGLMNVRPVWNRHGLTGRGQNITTCDSGLDTGDLVTLMADFTGRVHRIETIVLDDGARCNDHDLNGHGTHTAGSIVGNGTLSNGEVTGVAPGARLFVWQGARRILLQGQPVEAFYAPTTDDLFQPDKADFPAFIASCSWGYSYSGVYTTPCREVDDYVWRHPENLGVFAAGNTGSNGETAVVDPASAKNVLAVGASETRRTGLSSPYADHADNPAQIARFSNQGPTADGRIKPDVCAPGTMILSTRTTQVPATNTVGWLSCTNNPNYTYNSGTSMSAALVAGSAALVREWLTTRRGMPRPTAALVKAILMGGARDRSDDAGADCGGAAPNNRQGWGRIDLEETLYPSNRAVRCIDRIPFAAGETFTARVTTTNGAPLEVQLVWIDHPADVLAATALVNDLDLVVSNETTGVVWRGNGVEGGDRVNTVESVRIPATAPGTYAIRVTGVTVPYDSTEGGAAALYVRGAFPESVRTTVLRIR